MMREYRAHRSPELGRLRISRRQERGRHRHDESEDRGRRRDEEQRLRQKQDDAMARAREAVIARKEAECWAEEQWRHDQDEAQAAEAPPVAETTQVAPAPNAIAPQRLPPELACPITDEIMQDPVMAADGHTYERRAITEWFTRNDTSPITNAVLDHTNLTPNHLARALAQRFRDECRAAGVDPDSLN